MRVKGNAALLEPSPADKAAVIGEQKSAVIEAALLGEESATDGQSDGDYGRKTEAEEADEEQEEIESHPNPFPQDPRIDESGYYLDGFREVPIPLPAKCHADAAVLIVKTVADPPTYQAAWSLFIGEADVDGEIDSEGPPLTADLEQFASERAALADAAEDIDTWYALRCQDTRAAIKARGAIQDFRSLVLKGEFDGAAEGKSTTEGKDAAEPATTAGESGEAKVEDGGTVAQQEPSGDEVAPARVVGDVAVEKPVEKPAAPDYLADEAAAVEKEVCELSLALKTAREIVKSLKKKLETAVDELAAVNERIGEEGEKPVILTADGRHITPSEIAAEIVAEFAKEEGVADPPSPPSLVDSDGNGESPAPAGPDPNAWRAAPLKELMPHGLTLSLLARLEDNGITNVGELEDLRAGKGLTSVQRIGQGRADIIENAVLAWLGKGRDREVLREARG